MNEFVLQHIEEANELREKYGAAFDTIKRLFFKGERLLRQFPRLTEFSNSFAEAYPDVIA